MKKQVILVAGYEYHHGRTNIANVCKRRANLLLHQNPTWQNDPEVKFVLFDIRNGRVDKGLVNNGRIDWSLESDAFDPIDDRAHYDSDRHFVQNDTNVISITDAYEYIQNIGENDRGTVHEFTILGHGWRGGPVLVNSYQRAEYSRGGSRASQRDPWDKDGRKKDTNVTNMNDTDWRNFVRAFAANGRVWVWGCAASRLYKGVIQKVLGSREFGTKRYGSHADTDIFTLNFNRSFADQYFSYDPLFFFRSQTSQTVTDLSITRTLREVKDFLIRAMAHTYAAQMAYNTRIKVHAALPGTGADYERGGNSRRRVMVVPRDRAVYGYSYNRIVRFYKTYLNMREDPDQRGYAVYHRAQVNVWKNG